MRLEIRFSVRLIVITMRKAVKIKLECINFFFFKNNIDN